MERTKARWEYENEIGEIYCTACGGRCTGLIDKPQQLKNGILWALVPPPYCARCGAEMEKMEK